MSPLRSSAGPATERMPTPSSSRTMCARLVLPRPGGPTSRTWSSASPLPFAASSATASCSLMRAWPTNSTSRRGRRLLSTSPSSSPSVAARDGAAQLGDRRAGDDRECDLGPDAAHREQLDEQLALAAVGEAVELERVLAHVEVRLDGDLVGRVALPHGRRCRVDEVAHA